MLFRSERSSGDQRTSGVQRASHQVSKATEAKTATERGTKKENSVRLASWVNEWLEDPKPVTVKLAIHGVVPEIELQAVVPASQQRICDGDKCYEVSDVPAEAKGCEQSGCDSTQNISDEDPIMIVPAAPPIPPSYPFAMGEASYREEPNIFGTLSSVQISVPASTLVGYMIAHAENTVRLEMTEQLAAERAMYAQRYQLLLQQNQQLQTQLAMLESRQQTNDALTASLLDRAESAVVAANNQDSPKEGWETIQEDLSNIRRQIALLKRSNPVPFAPSAVGVPSEYSAAPWRTARMTPYVPVYPLPVAPELQHAEQRSVQPSNPETITK